MQCTCGFDNGPNALFCGKCGLPLGTDVAGAGRNAAASTATQPSAATGTKAPERKMSRPLVAVVAVAAVAAGYWWLNRPPDYRWVGRYAECRYSLEVMAPGVGSQTGEMVSRHVGSEQIGGRTYQSYAYVASGLPMPQTTTYLREAADGIYMIEGDRTQPEHKVLTLPLRVGATWSYDHPTEGRMACSAEAEEAAELLSQRYERSIRVSCNSAAGLTSTTYYAPGIGAVKSMVTKDPARVTYALVKCK